MILVFGSIDIDMVVPVANLPRAGETVLGPSYRLVPGGKEAKQARLRAGGIMRDADLVYDAVRLCLAAPRQDA